MRAPPRPIAANRIALMGATALGCSLVVLGAAPAMAQDVVIIEDVVVSDRSTNGAIDYRGRENVTITANSVTSTGRESPGVYVDSRGQAAVSVGEVSSQDDSGIQVYGDNGVSVVSERVTSYSTGISTFSKRNISIDSGVINSGHDGISAFGTGEIAIISDSITSGSRGIFVEGRGGAVSVNSGSIVADGDGMNIDSVGALDIVSGSISTTGNDNLGMRISVSDAPVTIRSGSISTTGGAATGIDVRRLNDTTPTGDVTIVSGTIDIVGPYGEGIHVETGGDINIESGAITTQGLQSRAISLHSTGGNVTVDSGSVTTAGDESHGIHARADAGSIVIDSGSVVTAGDYSDGIFAQADGGSVVIDSDSVATAGLSARGIVALATGDVTIRSGSVTTVGDEADGIHVLVDPDGVGLLTAAAPTRIDITAASVATQGLESHGIHTIGGDTVSIDVGSVTTAGDSARGIKVEGAGDVVIRADSIQTSGQGAEGMNVTVDTGDVSFDIGSIRTTGTYGQGLSVYTAGKVSGHVDDIRIEGLYGYGMAVTGGEVDLSFGTIETLNRYSAGLHSRSSGAMTIKGGSITTADYNAEGVNLSADGHLTLTLNSVTTTGELASGLYIVSDSSADIAVGSITTAGDEAHGVELRGDGGDWTLKSNTITTAGDNAIAVLLLGGETATYDIELGDVITTGVEAAGITTTEDGGLDVAGSITLKANSITTSGDWSHGLYLLASSLDVTVAEISTTGDLAVGAVMGALDADASALAVKATFGTIETSGANAFALGVNTTGRFDVAANSIHTRGEQAMGVAMVGEGGGVLKVGSILTEGDYASGAILQSMSAGLDVTINEIETRGVDAEGLHLETLDDSIVRVGKVRTSGARSNGVNASSSDGDVTLTANDVRTTGAGANGVQVSAGGDAILTVGSVEVTGSEADAVTANAAGAVRMTAAGRVTSGAGFAASLTGNSIEATLGAGSVVEGGVVGLWLDSATTSLVNNAGTITSTDGYAIEAVAGAVTLNNAGLVSGRVAFAGGDDVVNNTGRFTAHGASDFGAGADVFTNTGIIDLAAGTGPRTASFDDLERLNNAGTINLSNGVAGDVFTVSGILDGQAGNSIALDLDFRGAPAADRIVAGGFAGLNHITAVVQGDAIVGDTGLVLAQSGMAQTGAEIDVDIAGGAFVNYALVLTGNEYRLVGELALPAFEPTKIASGAQHQWTSGADVVSARFEQMRDGGVREGEGVQVWSQMFDGSSDIEAERVFDLDGERIDADLSHEVKSRGLQAGVDRSVPVADGSLVFGVLASAGKTELRFQNGDRTEYDGVGVGAYGHWTRGRLSLGGLAKFDHFDLDYDWAEAGLRTRADGFTLGVRMDAAWRVDLGDTWYVEPQGSLSWTNTELDGIEAATGAVDFGQTRSLVARLGVRVGGVVAVSPGLTLRPYAGLHILNEFDGENESRLLLGDESYAVRDEPHGDWGRATLGASLGGATGFGGFVQAEQDFGQVEGFTARAGVRYAW